MKFEIPEMVSKIKNITIRIVEFLIIDFSNKILYFIKFYTQKNHIRNFFFIIFCNNGLFPMSGSKLLLL
jgi:hypothetical protein